MAPNLMLDLLMSRLGNRTEPSLRAICLSEMVLAQQTALEGGDQLFWFLITEDATAVTEVDERRVELPSDFIREVDEEKPLLYVPSDDTDEIQLIKKAYDEALSHYGSTAEGPPEVYALRGDYLMIFPKPDDVYTLKFPGYYARQTVVSDTGTENAWTINAPDLLLAETGVVVATQHLQNPDKATLFLAQVARARERLVKLETAREEANRNRRMG